MEAPLSYPQSLAGIYLPFSQERFLPQAAGKIGKVYNHIPFHSLGKSSQLGRDLLVAFIITESKLKEVS